MLLALPVSIDRDCIGKQTLPDGTRMELKVGDEWAETSLVTLDEHGASFTYSAFVANLIGGRRVRARLSASGSPALPVLLEIETIQVAPGTGERIAQARFVAMPLGLRRWVASLG